MVSLGRDGWPRERQMVGRAVFHAEGLRRPRLASAWRTLGATKMSRRRSADRTRSRQQKT
jgi:hypothetical protein